MVDSFSNLQKLICSIDKYGTRESRAEVLCGCCYAAGEICVFVTTDRCNMINQVSRSRKIVESHDDLRFAIDQIVDVIWVTPLHMSFKLFFECHAAVCFPLAFLACLYSDRST